MRPTAATADNPIRDFRETAGDKSEHRPSSCSAAFQSLSLRRPEVRVRHPRRKLAVILERDYSEVVQAAKGQFQIYYKSGLDQREYQPDFVAETLRRDRHAGAEAGK